VPKQLQTRKRVLNSENWIMPLFNPAEGRCPTQNIDHAK
jgi:hypothetical protein